MTTTIALVNQKGGVGKTTSTINLAATLQARGMRVLAVDMDPQASLTEFYGYVPEEVEAEGHAISHALLEGKPVQDLILKGNPDLLATSERLAYAEPEHVTALRDALAPLYGQYDYILVDAPPTLTMTLTNVLAAARYALIPAQTSGMSVKGVIKIVEAAYQVQSRANPALRILCVLPTLYKRGNRHDQEKLRELHDAFEPELKVFDPINFSTSFDKADEYGRATVELFPTAPGVDVYHRLADYIINHTYIHDQI